LDRLQSLDRNANLNPPRDLLRESLEDLQEFPSGLLRAARGGQREE
jgi:hypothetical protein